MTDFQIPIDGAAELPTGSERATSRRAADPMVVRVVEVLQGLRAVVAAATGDRSRSFSVLVSGEMTW